MTLDYDAVEDRSRRIDIARANVTPICEAWRDDLVAAGGARLKDIRQLATDAGIKGCSVRPDGCLTSLEAS